MPEDIGFCIHCPAKEQFQTPWHLLVQRLFQK